MFEPEHAGEATAHGHVGAWPDRGIEDHRGDGKTFPMRSNWVQVEDSNSLPLAGRFDGSFQSCQHSKLRGTVEAVFTT